MTPADFIATWNGVLGNERGNHQLFVNDLCELLAVPKPGPWSDDRDNQYTNEFRVQLSDLDGIVRQRSIDCYYRGHFILEAKSANRKGSKRGTPKHALRLREAARQAADYERALALAPSSQPPIPFLIVVDIGGSFDLYADFSKTRRGYQPFPRPGANRIALADLAQDAVRAQLRQIWLDPYALDPAATAQRVTRTAAAQLAGLARSLRTPGNDRATIAGFLIRYFFCAFAEDIGLLKKDQFTIFLRNLRPSVANAHRSLTALWADLHIGGFSTVLGDQVPQINGGLFKKATALPLTAEQLELLIRTAEMRWDEVEPAIFGTLLEQALDADERHSLGAHFTPRAYVELLVEATVMTPLRAEWDEVRTVIGQLLPTDETPAARGPATKAAQELIARFTGASRDQARQGRRKQGNATARSQTVEEHATDLALRLLDVFHRRLSDIRVLDPACGTGNFLYVALDLLKRLEAEVMALEHDLGAATARVDDLGIDPRNFLGLELNPEAVPVAELVLWIGWLQWYRRSRPADNLLWPKPVLRDYAQIHSQDALIAYTGKEPTGATRWDGTHTILSPTTNEPIPDPAARVPVYAYHGVTKAVWPKADFIVGNPPFIGNKRLRTALGDGYTEALRAAWSDVPETADLVMYWWHHAAILARSGAIRRFGFITTNSITQTHQRAVMQPHFAAGLGLAWAIPDHPWVDTEGGAAVRVAMTVAQAGVTSGTLLRVASEIDHGAELAEVNYATARGAINGDLTTGADVTRVASLKSNLDLSYMGVTPFGQGFLVTADEAKELDGTDEGKIHPYFNGKDLTDIPRKKLIIDLFGLNEDQVRQGFPKIYQHLFDRVRPEQIENNRESYREKWWLFAEARSGMRRAINGLSKYIATCRTARHRTFQFINSNIIPDSKIVVIASDDSLILGVLSSKTHVVFATLAGSHLGVGNDANYNNSTCFGAFPFPTPTAAQATRIRDLAEQLDAHRKRQQAAHPEVTLTGMYNVLAKLRAGTALTPKEQAIHTQGLVAVLRQLHDDLDAAVADAYDWPVDLPEAELLTRLVALNAKRAAEEKVGKIRWLRPDFQAPGAATVPDTAPQPWPASLAERMAAVRAQLGTTGLTARALGRRFTRARVADVSELLTALAALGHARVDGDRWFAV